MDSIEFQHEYQDWQAKIVVSKEKDGHNFTFEAILTNEEGDTHSFVVLILSQEEVLKLVKFLMSNGEFLE